MMENIACRNLETEIAEISNTIKMEDKISNTPGLKYNNQKFTIVWNNPHLASLPSHETLEDSIWNNKSSMNYHEPYPLGFFDTSTKVSMYE